MSRKKCIAMILAGGQGSRLGVLTYTAAKPVVPFGGKYRIIDFTLSNCANSGIDTVGVLTQYQPHELNTYIGSGQPWDMDRYNGGIYILPPYLKGNVKGNEGEWYKGTANAIFQNVGFIEQFDPENVLILSGDHIYIMDYSEMLDLHRSKNADATIAVITVPWEEASRFGILTVSEETRITEFNEKPKEPQSNLASMGVYIFKWKELKKYLILDDQTEGSSNDFGKNIIPMMLNDNARLFAHEFKSYWKDVGTIESLWQANMDLLTYPPVLDLRNKKKRIYSRNPIKPPHFTADGAEIHGSLVTEGSVIHGNVRNSVIADSVRIGKDSEIINSVVFPNVVIGENCRIYKTMIGKNTVIGDNCAINDGRIESDASDADIANAGETATSFLSEYCTGGVTLIGDDLKISDNTVISANSMVDRDI